MTGEIWGKARRTMSLFDAFAEFDAALEWQADDDPLLEPAEPVEWPSERPAPA